MVDLKNYFNPIEEVAMPEDEHKEEIHKDGSNQGSNWRGPMAKRGADFSLK